MRSDQRFRRDRIDSVNEAVLARALLGARGAGQVQYRSALSARDTVAGFAPVPGHDWTVAVTADRAGLTAPLLAQQAWLGTGTLAVAGLLAAAAWWVGRTLTQPLRRLQHAMQDLKNGDYEDAHLPQDRADEIGQTMRGFNALSAQLRQRHQAEQGGSGAAGDD